MRSGRKLCKLRQKGQKKSMFLRIIVEKEDTTEEPSWRKQEKMNVF